MQTARGEKVLLCWYLPLSSSILVFLYCYMTSYFYNRNNYWQWLWFLGIFVMCFALESLCIFKMEILSNKLLTHSVMILNSHWKKCSLHIFVCHSLTSSQNYVCYAPPMCLVLLHSKPLCRATRSGAGARSEGWGDARGWSPSDFSNCSVQLQAGNVWIPGEAFHATANIFLFHKSGLGQRQLDFWRAKRSVNAGESWK